MNKSFIKLARMVYKFSEVKTDKGLLVTDDGLEVGTEVAIETEDDTLIPEDGAYTAEDGTIYEIKDGKIAEVIKPAEESVEIELKAEEEPAESPIEEPVKEEPEEDKDAIIQKLTEENEAYKAQIEALEQRIKELENDKLAPVEESLEMKAQVEDKETKARGALRYFQH